MANATVANATVVKTTSSGVDRPVPPVDDSEPKDSVFGSWQVVAALTVVVVAIGVAVTLGLIHKNSPVVDNAPLPMATVGQPGADSAACRSLMPALPQQLAGENRRTLEGATDGIAAWGDPAAILRCGLETPEEFTCSSALNQVNGVTWLQLSDSGGGQTTYIAADRSVRVALTIPDGSGTGVIQQISNVIAATLPVRAPCSDGQLLPTDTK